MKTLFLLLTLATALLIQSVNANETTSVYQALVEIQTLDEVYSYASVDKNPYQMDLGSRRVSGYSERRNRLFGWSGPVIYNDISIRTGAQIESTGESTFAPPTTGRSASGATQGLRVKPYTGLKLGPNELPYIDAQGNKNNNYAILLTATWCTWCHKMYNDTVEPLRKKGFKIYIIDIDEFPDIKTRIYRLDKTAQRMGRGVPYFIIRQSGKTTKIIQGYTSADKIRPHLKKLQEHPDEPYDLRLAL